MKDIRELTDAEKLLIEAGQKLIAAFGHRPRCPVLSRPEWVCGCGQADEHGEALSAWRNALDIIMER